MLQVAYNKFPLKNKLLRSVMIILCFTIECKSEPTDVVFVIGSASQNIIGAMEALSMVQTVISDNKTLVG